MNKNLEHLAGQIVDVPWTQIAGMRDQVTHRYFDIDHRVVWHTLTADLPSLEKAVRDFVGEADQ